MSNKIRTILITLAAVFSLAAPLALTATVSAESGGSPDINSGLCQGVNLQAGNTGCNPANDTAANDKINTIIKLVINIFSLVVGVVAVIMIIVGGLKYITSGGDSGNITGAKNTILYAIVGLVVVALAQFIVRFVLGKVTAT